MTHEEAGVKFKRCRDKTKGYLLAKHTRLQKRGRAFAVRYHNTDVVIIRPDGKYRVNSGGWRTVTTKNRINDAIPELNLHSTKGVWHIRDRVYIDGMLFDADGDTTELTKPSLSEMLYIKRKVDSRCRQFVDLVGSACMMQDIGDWEINNIPNKPLDASNRIHIKRLWKSISHLILDRHSRRIPLFAIWIRKAVVAQDFIRPLYEWTSIKDSISVGRLSYGLENSLKSLFLKMKPMIVDQIAFGDLRLGG